MTPPAPISTLFPYTTLFRSSLDGKRFEDVYVTDLQSGERKKALTRVRWVFSVSPDGTHLLYHDDGHFRTLELATLNRSEEHTSELQSLAYLVCRLLLEKKNV